MPGTMGSVGTHPSICLRWLSASAWMDCLSVSLSCSLAISSRSLHHKSKSTESSQSGWEMGDVGQPTCIRILSLMNFSLTCELSSRRDDWGPWQSLMSFRRKMHTLYNFYYITLITGYIKTDCTMLQQCTFYTYGYWLPVFYTTDNYSIQYPQTDLKYFINLL